MSCEVISSKSRMREFPGAHLLMVQEDQQIAEAAECSELEWVSPHIKRAVTVVARDQLIVRSISEADFGKLANRFPVLCRNIARIW